MRKLSLLLTFILLSATFVFAQNAPVTQGTLNAFGKKGVELGACPLKHTDVKAEISGFVSRVKVVQEFENNFAEPIEAVYVFPLSQNSAVDRMTMKIGTRTINGKIMKREEARKIYETAKTEGKTASLLDQERPNIFTQSVANILPNEKIIIEISYVETLKYEDGAYQFVFPMVVGPRYIPNSVSDANKISPPIAETRAGHDISIEVNLDAGVPIEEIRSKSHDIQTINLSPNSAKVTLRDENTIPNKDFILNYDVSGKRIEDAVLTHRDERGGFFTLILQPPDNFAVEDVTPKEIVFVLDTSGSMSGFPIEKAKEAMKMSLEGLYPNDTFNLITFAGDTAILFDKPVYATRANLDKAQEFLASRNGGGGTEMMKAIKAALEPSDAQNHLRIVCFMTDGYVGNENEIIAEVQKHQNARVFSFGIGSSVNRFLLDKIAEEGRGEAEYVALEDEGSKAAKKFYERVRTPLLTDISIDWNNLPVADVYPNKISDLFSAKPVILHGRYTKAASGMIRLKGKVNGQELVREIPVDLPEAESANDSLATLWARTRIDDLTKKDYQNDKPEVQQTITNLGLEYNLLTQFTSFVAVEEKIVNYQGKPKKIEVLAELPHGVSLEAEKNIVSKEFSLQMSAGRRNSRGIGQGSGSGKSAARAVNQFASVSSLSLSLPAKVISGGVVNGINVASLPTPSYPTAAKAVRANGVVNVQVTIDESGDVISASAVSGHQLLRQAAEQAAKNAKFFPTRLSGKAVKVTGVIVYNFVDAQNSATVMPGEMRVNEKDAPSLISSDVKIQKRLAEKLHFWIYDLAERLQKGETASTPNEAKFVK
ncbi:MAG: TonB family protein, partial [Acidobacteriota bacterium]